MNFTSSDIENFAIPLPITESSRQIASQFAATQPTEEKAQQVLLNTIAVKVVDNYLKMLNIATDLAGSDSWNPVMQICNNVADLNLPAIGKIECRPIRNWDTSCQIPFDVWDLRVGYLIVRIDEELRKAAIVGFTPQVRTEEFELANLQPPEAFIDRLHEIEESVTNNSSTNLSQWLDNIVATGWQRVETLLNPENLLPSYGFRNYSEPNSNSSESTADGSIARAKLIDIGVRLGELNVVLLVELTPEANGDFAITLRVYPQSNRIYLPEGLKLKVFELSDEVFLESQARTHDNYIQLKFSGQKKEIFRVEIILDEIKFSEEFKL
ncbi:MAG: DUF1822 family protein [Cyanobacteria bacterium P01_F01_bin.143]